MCCIHFTEMGATTMKVTAIGLDLAKSVFQVHGVDEKGHVLLRRALRRAQVALFFSNLPPCLIGMEACSSAHWWARKLEAMGHTVRLMAPQFVKPYVKGNKNDSRDAEAICEAVSRPHMRLVPLKTVESQDIQALHRLRSRLIKERTALVNQVRGLLAERGIVLAQRITRLRQQLPMIVEDLDNELTPLGREMMRELYDQLVALDERIGRADHLVPRVFTENAQCQKLARVEGIGPVIATGTGRRGRRRPGVCQRAASGSLAGARAPPMFQWRQRAPA